MNNQEDEPRTRLRRLLNQVEDQAVHRTNQLPNNSPLSPNPARPAGRHPTSEASPVRPLAPAADEPPPQIAPRARAVQHNTSATHFAGVEERLEAEGALEKLRQKTADIAKEYADGKLNQAQFAAMYAHINEKRVIIEQMLAKNPDTLAWQSVATAGHTTFLRQHFEARVLAYLLYDNGTVDPDTPLAMQSTKLPSPDVIKPILTALSMLLKTRTTDKPLRAIVKPLTGGHWIGIIPGTYTSAIVLFSLEPSANQFQRVVDLQRDFETANHASLARGVRESQQFVFPHRALFEDYGK